MKRRLVAIALALSLLLSACDLAPATPTPRSANDPALANLWNVTRVVDGDTIDVANVAAAKPVYRIRLIGIDTPETVDPRKPVQCFGREASREATLLMNGQQVKLEADPSQDDSDVFGRLLRYVFLTSGENVNLTMIRQGYAHEYTYRVPYKYQAEFKAAQRDAEREQAGLWSPSTCAGDTTKPAA